MKKACNLPLPASGYLLSEENQSKLQEIRNQWLLMAEIAYVSTLDEERVPLQIPRSILAQCFEHAAEQLSDVLAATLPCHAVRSDVSKRH
jgi:hypothetical protein